MKISKKEVLIAVTTLTLTASALFAGFTWLEDNFVDQAEFGRFSDQVLQRLGRIEEGIWRLKPWLQPPSPRGF